MARDDDVQAPLTDLAELGRRMRETAEAATARVAPLPPSDQRIGAFAEDDPDLHAQYREMNTEPDSTDTD